MWRTESRQTISCVPQGGALKVTVNLITQNEIIFYIPVAVPTKVKNEKLSVSGIYGKDAKQAMKFIQLFCCFSHSYH